MKYTNLLAAGLAAHFPPRRDGPRTIGREAEFPVVDQMGRAADIEQLWPLLMTGEESAERSARRSPSSPSPLKVKRDAVNPDLIVGLDGASYSYALEVGRGTIELNVGPCRTLFTLETAFRAGLARLVRAAAQLGWRVLGYGVQPLSPPSRGLLSPKQRYKALADIMGDDWIWYTVTASDQAHIDITRDEAVAVLNFGNLIAPVVVALCANSPVVAGAPTGDYSSPRRTHDPCSPWRPPRHDRPPLRRPDPTSWPVSASCPLCCAAKESVCCRTDAASPTFCARTMKPPRSDGCSLSPPSALLPPRPFDAFLLHDHYVWHSARLRTAYGTVEMRPACQPPPHEAMAAAALYTGLVEGHRQIAEYVQAALAPPQEQTLSGCWPRMEQYHRQVIRAGLAAPEPAPGFLAEILALTEAALARRGYGEERMLRPPVAAAGAKGKPGHSARVAYLRRRAWKG